MAVGTTQAARLGPDFPAPADPEVPSRPCCKTVKGGVYSGLHTAGDAEPSKHDESIRPRVWLSITDCVSMGIDVDGLGLQHVKVLRRPHAKADVTLEVARLVVMPLFARTVLCKVFRCSHDELSLVCWISHPLGVYGLMKVSVHGGQVDEGLVVQVRKDKSLKLLR